MLTYAELFAGAGGLSMGLEAAGFHAVAHAEIEPHARAVLRYRWPDTRLDGDVTKVGGRDYAGVTLLSGGSPCQDLSVAGKRAGLGGARSSLFYEQVRIWNESGAPYLLWENVGGALSSNNGRDFAAVLSALVGSAVTVPADGWRGGGGVVAGRDAVAAWRVLDLQHFGPPQRRVRVFVLAARAGGVDPAEVLALGEGVCGHSSPRQQAREGVAGGAAYGLNNDSKAGITEGGVAALRAGHRQKPAVLAFHPTQDPISGAVSPSLGTTTDGMGVLAFDTYNQSVGDVSHTLRDPNGTFGDALPAVICTTGHVTHALTHEGADASEDGTGRGTPIVARMVAFGEYATDGTASTIKQRDYKDATDLVVGARPRRLTPLECERLMSWPDEWTRYGRKEDGAVYELSDTARYRLCGNGVGSVCVQWIAERLARAVSC
jgi:DNA (cytosine-5)-methyltransferase 1